MFDKFDFSALATTPRIFIFIGLALGVHLCVLLLKNIVGVILSSQRTKKYRKVQSISTIATSTVVFVLYFLALGFILREFGVSLSTYLASASVIGLAIGFGSQGLVQDVVSGLTFVFSDIIDVGDLVKIGGETGVVRSISMRFIELENSYGARVFIPNRTVSTLINYPKGYIRCIVDVTLSGAEKQRKAMHKAALTSMENTYEQYPGILMREPSDVGRTKLKSGKEILRLKFRIWPDRTDPVEKAFKEELNAALTKLDGDYKPWMISVSYEAEKRITPAKRLLWGWKQTNVAQ